MYEMAEYAGVMDPSILALSQCFANRSQSHIYSNDLKNWAESNVPKAMVRLGLVELRPSLPYPYLVTVFFFIEDHKEIDNWFGKWIAHCEENENIPRWDEDSFGKSMNLIFHPDFMGFAPLTLWLGNRTKSEKSKAINRSKIEREETSEIPNTTVGDNNYLINCLVCKKSDAIRKVSSIVYGGTLTGSGAGPAFSMNGDIGIAFSRGRYTTQLAQLLSPPEEPTKGIFESGKSFKKKLLYWRIQMQVWGKLYYCFRDDIVFDPLLKLYRSSFATRELLSALTQIATLDKS